MALDLKRFETHGDFLSLGDICRTFLGKQAQYGCPYYCKSTAEKRDYPYLGEGLRITGTASDYHGMRIHKDDVEEAVRRFDNRESYR